MIKRRFPCMFEICCATFWSWCATLRDLTRRSYTYEADISFHSRIWSLVTSMLKDVIVVLVSWLRTNNKSYRMLYTCSIYIIFKKNAGITNIFFFLIFNHLYHFTSQKLLFIVWNKLNQNKIDVLLFWSRTSFMKHWT